MIGTWCILEVDEILNSYDINCNEFARENSYILLQYSDEIACFYILSIGAAQEKMFINNDDWNCWGSSSFVNK